jgi:hypothetical protein
MSWSFGRHPYGLRAIVETRASYNNSVEEPMKRVFVGLSGPIAFDYGKRPWRHDMPNPLLENVTGLLLCYDEIWFLSRNLCPEDLRDLPYVKFIEDDQALSERALVACDQYKPLAVEAGEAKTLDERIAVERSRGERTLEIVEFVKSQSEVPFLFDSHSRGTKIGEAYVGTSVPGSPENGILDWGVAQSLDLNLDVAINSPLATSLELLFEESPPEQAFQRWHIEAAELLLPLRTTDYLGDRGAYHESLEDLRAHRSVSEFRTFLAEAEAVDRDAIALSRHVSELAEKHCRDILERFVKGRSKVRTLGTASIGAAGNVVKPGLGSLLSGVITSAEWLKERSLRKRVAWSLFVVDAKRHQWGK